MSLQAPAWFEPYYTSQVVKVFQHRGFRLRGTTQQQTEIKSDKVLWRVAHPVVATKYERADDAVFANGARTKVEATFETWQVYQPVFDDDLEKMSIDEMAIATEAGANALGQRSDKEILGELNAGGPASPAVTDTTNGMTLAHAIELCEAAQTQTKLTWDGRWWCGLTPRLWNQLLVYKQFSSSDYVGQDLPLTKATDTRFWNGVNWFLFPHQETVDPWFPVPSANQVDIFLWHQTAIGYGVNYEIKNTIAWEQPRTAWTSNMRMAAKAKVLQQAGIVRGRFANNAAITPN